MYSLEHLLFPWTAYRFIVMSLILTHPMHVHLSTCMYMYMHNLLTSDRACRTENAINIIISNNLDP